MFSNFWSFFKPPIINIFYRRFHTKQTTCNNGFRSGLLSEKSVSSNCKKCFIRGLRKSVMSRLSANAVTTFLNMVLKHGKYAESVCSKINAMLLIPERMEREFKNFICWFQNVIEWFFSYAKKLTFMSKLLVNIAKIKVLYLGIRF